MFATVRINTPLESIEPFKSAAQARPLSLDEKARVRVASHEKESPHPNPLPKGEGTDSEEPSGYEFLVVPERAVIDTGSRKVVYVEREPGMFEGVEVQLGPRQGEVYPVIKGLNPGDKVAAAGGFLIDAETRLNPAAAATYFGASGGPQSTGRPNAPAIPGSQRPGDQAPTGHGKPSQLPAGAPTPPKSEPQPMPKGAVAALTDDELKNIEQLPAEDRKLALEQRVCPVTGEPLGSMGVPVKITLRGQPVFLCCKGCTGAAKRNPDEILKKLATPR
jgi:hypothetical protein